jgi:hypothetical protein
MAARAEAVGFAPVWTSDHLVIRYSGEPTHGVLEGWTLLAALAARTGRFRARRLPLVTYDLVTGIDFIPRFPTDGYHSRPWLSIARRGSLCKRA